MARTVESVVQAVGIDRSAMPDRYTREQYEALPVPPSGPGGEG